MRKRTKQERTEALDRLREMLSPGDTVHTVIRNVSRSGMSRSIDVYLMRPDGPRDVEKLWLSGLVATACSMSYDEKRECIKIGGCGMDMGFALVYELSRQMWPKGFTCAGQGAIRLGRLWCPSNDHSNGDRDYSRRKSHVHKDGGYALRQEWIG